jgi:hypothetical protein
MLKNFTSELRLLAKNSRLSFQWAKKTMDSHHNDGQQDQPTFIVLM